MGSNQATGDKSRVSANIPTNQKEALFLLAKQRSARQRENVSMAEILRDYIEQGLEHEDDLPEEARDLLDDDLIANAGDTDGDGEPEVTEA
jgi:hypothetical protein